MATKTKKKTIKKTTGKTSKLRSFMLRHKVFSTIALVIVASVLSVYFYQAITSYQDEQTAQQYKTQLDEIDKKMAVEFEKVIKELGVPDERMHEKTCEYPSAKGDPGDPRCGSSYLAEYVATDNSGVLTLFDKAKREATSTLGFSFKNQYMSKESTQEDFSTHIYVSKDTQYGIRCSSNIYVDDNADMNGGVYLTLVYSCRKTSPKPIYREVNKH